MKKKLCECGFPQSSPIPHEHSRGKNVVAYKISKSLATDQTPIYGFCITTPLHPGDILEWDTEKSELIYKGNHTTHS